MFNSVFGRTHKSGIWRRAASEICELPQLAADLPHGANQLVLVAGGLALVLSRCSPKDVDREFPNANELYRILRSELKQHGRTSASAELILDTLHEVSERLDPLSRNAMRACLEARRKHDRVAAPAIPLAPQSNADRMDAPNSRAALQPSAYEVIESDVTLPAHLMPSLTP